MVSKLVEVGVALGVGGNDVREIRRRKSLDILTRIAQFSTLAASAIVGVLAAEAMYPASRSAYGTYPFVPIMLASLTTPHRVRRSWTGTIILSTVLFIVTFVFVALVNTATNDNYGVAPEYGVTPKYGVFPGGSNL